MGSMVDSLVSLKNSAVLGVAESSVNLSLSAFFVLVSVNMVLCVFKDSTFPAECPLVRCLGMTFSVSVVLCVSLSATCSADSLSVLVLVSVIMVARASFLLCCLC